MNKRVDERMPDEMRPIKLTLGAAPYAEGSCLAEFGGTRVLCAASVEEKVPLWLKGQQQGWVTAEYGMLPRSTHTRTPRENSRGGPSGRTQEIQRLIGRSLRSMIDLKALGERTITVDCDVLQADGGTRTAAITGGFVALAAACDVLCRRNQVKVWPIQDTVAAISVGVVGGTAVIDLCYEEDCSAAVDMNIVMTGAGKYVEVQGTAEGAPFSRKLLDELLELGSAGIALLTQDQRAVLGSILTRS